MRLLVSVRNRQEAEAAFAGGADIIDAKDPAAGPLGAVSTPTLHEICGVGKEACPITAALGDAGDDVAIERMAWEFAVAGATLLKVGFAGVAEVERAVLLLSAAIRGASRGPGGRCGVVAVAYADAHLVASLDRHRMIETAVRGGAAGVLLDTADKHGTGLAGLLSRQDLAAWVRRAHEAGLLVAVAGKLQAEDLTMAREAGADIAGVRGAACEGGRTGTISTERVRALRTLCGAIDRKPSFDHQRTNALRRFRVRDHALHPSGVPLEEPSNRRP